MDNCDVFLVRPEMGTVKTFRTPFPPFEYLFLAPKLSENGYNVKIIDLQLEKISDLTKALKNSNPIWIGLTTPTGPSIDTALVTAEAIRGVDPSIPIVFGGPHPTLMPEQTAKHDLVDIVVVGEGERTAVALTKALEKNENLKTVDGLVFKKDGQIYATKQREFIKDWDSEVNLDWTYIDVSKYINRVDGFKNLPFITGRGCPHRCNYCWNLNANRRTWRGWSAEGAIEQIRKILTYGVNYITFQDDNFGVNIPRLEKIIKFLQAENIRWSADNGFRVGKHITEDLLKKFKDSGCHHIAFGAESGSQRILDYVNKDITVEQIINSAEVTKQNGIGAKYTWMIGFPAETREDIFASLDLIEKIKKINPLTTHVMNIFYPYPGTVLFDEAIKHGWKPPDSLEKWSGLRETLADYPYVENMTYLKSIQFSSYHAYGTDAYSRTYYQTHGMVRLLLSILRYFSKIRFNKRFFSVPIEYAIVTKTSDLLNALKKYKTKYSI